MFELLLHLALLSNEAVSNSPTLINHPNIHNPKTNPTKKRILISKNSLQ